MSTVHPAAPPNDLQPAELRVRPGADGVTLAVDPARAGWRYLSFRSVALAGGDSVDVGVDGQEAVIVTISGGGATVEPSGAASLALRGRGTVVDGLPWAAYLPPGTSARVVGAPDRAGGTAVLAVAQAPPSGRAGVSREPILISPDDVRIEVRGSGNATRQINHIVEPAFPADRLLVVEVYTPGGNWSSWPPHKHDIDAMPDEAVLEEIYYYQIARPEGWAVQRLYRLDGSRDAVWAVRDGELVLVTDGYHPVVATHGYDAYYLNALAGDRRTMACTDDPDLAWTRAAWDTMAADPRVPLVTR